VSSGSGTYGGGGWDTHKALKVIQEAGTSIALFAPGWTFEAQVMVAESLQK